MTMTLRYVAQTLEIGMDFDAQVVRDGEGRVRTVRSGEVSVRGLYGYVE